MSSPVSEQDSGFDVKIAKKLAEFKDFAAAVDAKLNERRLEDMHSRMEKTEEAQLKRQLESTLRDLRDHQYALSSTKERLADMEKQTCCPNCGNSSESPEGKDDCEMDVDMPNALQGMQCDDPAEPVGSQPPSVSCPSCDVKQRSLRLSNLHVRAMELRVSLSERRISETENCTAWLVRALQNERRKRRDTEAALLVENQRRRDAEAGAEAIVHEAESPFVVPAMLDMFLRFEGIIADIAGA